MPNDCYFAAFAFCTNSLGDGFSNSVTITYSTHRGHVMYIFVNKLGHHWYGLAPMRHQVIARTYALLLSIGPPRTNIATVSFMKINFKMSSAKCRPPCVGLNVLKIHICCGNIPVSSTHIVQGYFTSLYVLLLRGAIVRAIIRWHRCKWRAWVNGKRKTKLPAYCMYYIDGLVQDCSYSSALAMELLQSCTKPPILFFRFPWCHQGKGMLSVLLGHCEGIRRWIPLTKGQ